MGMKGCFVVSCWCRTLRIHRAPWTVSRGIVLASSMSGLVFPPLLSFSRFALMLQCIWILVWTWISVYKVWPTHSVWSTKIYGTSKFKGCDVFESVKEFRGVVLLLWKTLWCICKCLTRTVVLANDPFLSTHKDGHKFLLVFTGRPLKPGFFIAWNWNLVSNLLFWFLNVFLWLKRL